MQHSRAASALPGEEEEEEGFAGAQGGRRDLESVVLPLESRVFRGERPCLFPRLFPFPCRAPPAAGMMQELVAAVEKISFGSEADVEELRARALPFPRVDSVPGHPRPAGAKPAVCKHWLRGLCKRGDGCDFLHEHDATRVPECRFYPKFGERSDKDRPFPHVGATATVGCPWYDRGFCWHGPLCKYKHTRRVMCANYLAGFCPEGPKCKFVHLKAGLMMSSTDPSKDGGCPWGLVQRDLAAGERGGEHLPAKEPPPRGTRHLAAHLWDTSGCPPSPQSLLEGGTCSKRGSASPCASQSRRTPLEMLLGE